MHSEKPGIAGICYLTGNLKPGFFTAKGALVLFTQTSGGDIISIVDWVLCGVSVFNKQKKKMNLN